MRRLAIASLAVFACATPYQPRAIRGGYSDMQVGDNVFRVSFEGNGYLSAQTASDYALLRSAELTLEKGFRYFVIAGDEARGTVVGGGNAHAAFVTTMPSSMQTIVCYAEKPLDPAGLLYDAVRVRAAVRERYGIGDAPPADPSAAARTALVSCESSRDCDAGHACVEGYCR